MTGPFIGSLPPTKDKELKWWGQTIFRNTLEVLPGRYLSTPPPQPDYAQWDVSRRLKEDINYACNVFYGKKGAKWKLEKHRICWLVNTLDKGGQKQTDVFEGMLSPPVRISSFPHIQPPKVFTSRPVVLSTAGSSFL